MLNIAVKMFLFLKIKKAMNNHRLKIHSAFKIYYYFRVSIKLVYETRLRAILV